MDISRSQMDLKKDTIIKKAQAMQLPQKTSDKTWKLELFSFLPFLGWNQYGVFQVKICNQYCEIKSSLSTSRCLSVVYISFRNKLYTKNLKFISLNNCMGNVVKMLILLIKFKNYISRNLKLQQKLIYLFNFSFFHFKDGLLVYFISRIYSLLLSLLSIKL